jgi:hypothetical protein
VQQKDYQENVSLVQQSEGLQMVQNATNGGSNGRQLKISSDGKFY